MNDEQSLGYAKWECKYHSTLTTFGGSQELPLPRSPSPAEEDKRLGLLQACLDWCIPRLAGDPGRLPLDKSRAIPDIASPEIHLFRLCLTSASSPHKDLLWGISWLAPIVLAQKP